MPPRLTVCSFLLNVTRDNDSVIDVAPQFVTCFERINPRRPLHFRQRRIPHSAPLPGTTKQHIDTRCQAVSVERRTHTRVLPCGNFGGSVVSLKMRLLRVAGLLGLLVFVGLVLPKLGPQAPGQYSGTAPQPTTSSTISQVPSATTSSAQKTTASKPPPGFPSMEFAPPEIAVPEGDPIPIDTKYGISYTVPGDWRFGRGGVVGWNKGEHSLRFGDIADFGYDYCPEFRDGGSKAMTGITGRHEVDVATAAFDVSRQTEMIFRDKPTDDVTIEYSEPVDFQIEGAPAVRYTVTASNLAQQFECDPPAASIDIVAMQGYSNATVAVFMVLAEQQTDRAISQDTIDDIIASLRRSS